MIPERFYNIEAEQQVLGAILKNNDVICDVVDIIKAEDFHDTKNQLIYTSILELYKANKSIDITILSEKLMTRLNEVGGITYLSELYGSSFPYNIKNYIEIIKEKSNMRKIKVMLQTQLNELENGKYKSFEIMNKVQSFNINTEQDKQLINDCALMDLTIKTVEDNYKSGGRLLGIPIGIRSIDKAINGLQKEKLYIIAGRPGMAKSAFALNICQNTSKDHVVAYYSLEMSEEELGIRRLAMTSFIDSTKIERGNLDDKEWDVLIKNAGQISNDGKCFTNCRPGIDLNSIRAQCKKIQLQHELDLLIVDYIGLIDRKGMGDNLREEIGNICVGLKNISKEFKIPVIALSQINRGPESRTDKRPKLSDLKESGGVEENADVVMLLYRDEYYNKGTEDPGVLEVDIAKQRGGRTGVLKLSWRPEYQKVTDIA